MSYSNGMSAAAVAAAYKAACIATLPVPPLNPNGYGAVTETSVSSAVRLGKQSGGYKISSDTNLPPGITMHTLVPSNAEHAPAASPAGLVALAASLSAMAWWVRRRKAIA